MTRPTAAMDRLATAIVGILLVAGGAAVLIWDTALVADIPESITAPGLVRASETSWWPWASAGAGIVLALVALRWLVAHRPTPRIDRTAIDGTFIDAEDVTSGRATADITALASASARALEIHTCVKKASAKAVIDRRQRIIMIDATAQSPELLGEAALAADQVARDAITMIGDSSLATRTVIHIEKRGKTARKLS